MAKLAPILAGGLRCGGGLGCKLAVTSGARRPPAEAAAALACRWRSSTAVTDGAATEPAYRRMKGPHGEPVPRMHSAWIPAWQELMRRRRIGQQDDGVRLYEKFPFERFAYRASWAYLWLGVGYTGYQVALYLIEHSPLN